MGDQGPSRANRQLKQTLLAQCGIGYWVISPDSLPEPQRLRAAFLGEQAADRSSQPDPQQELAAVRHQLHEALDRNRHHRQRASQSRLGDDDELAASPQQDSFLGPLDSRALPLNPR